MRMSADFTFLLIFFIMSVFKVKTSNLTTQNCGGQRIMHDAHGVIHTPNFPKPFAVPIRCRWVIDASNYSNPTIYLYFTQMFVTTGLHIAEYTFYDKNDSTGYSEQTILVLSSHKVLDIEFTRTNCTFLVIDFELNQLEGNHVRALHNLMDVYGFNITYEITTNGAPRNRCTVLDCSLAGHCYASYDFSSYNCSCFEGFSGENCGYGPLCQPDKNDCQNGASCRHAGETAAVCVCPDRYTGVKCEIFKTNQSLGFASMINKTVECPYQADDEKAMPCSCENGESIQEVSDRARYLFTVHLANRTTTVIENPTTAVAHRRANILEEIRKFFKEDKSWKSKLPTILNTTQEGDVIRSVMFHVFSNKSPPEITEKLNAMVKNNVIEAFSPVRKVAPLHLMKVSMNREEDVLENQEFILSCIAKGSPSITFQWYKDGIPINDSLAVRDLWFRVLSYNSDDKYVGMLTITRAELFDAGIYTCQAKDGEQQQCSSIAVNVAEIPDVKITPFNVIVEKGRNVTLHCLSKSDWQTSSDDLKYGYTWLRDNKVFPFDVPNLYWEDLHKGGSVLHVNNVQKSDVFKCEVVGKRRNSASVRVDILNKEETPYCEKDGVWPMTAPGVTAMQDCPANYSGNVSVRLCMMTDASTAEWQLPDFSNCISSEFISITENFRKLTYGYENETVNAADTLKALWSSLTERCHEKLLPGEGESFVNFLKKSFDFLGKTRNVRDLENSTPYFYGIVDILLQDSTSILNQKAIFSLSNLIERWPTMWTSNKDVKTSAVRGENATFDSTRYKSFEFHAPKDQKQVITSYTNVTVKFETSFPQDRRSKSAKLGVMMYKNLSHILLPEYVSDLRNDKQLLYKLSSPIIHVLLLENSIRKKRNANFSWLQVDVDFKLPLYYESALKWDICCGIVESFGQSWSLDICKSTSLSDHAIRCSCNHGGLFAIFAAELPNINDEVDRRYHIIVIVGCTCCLVQCMISFLVLLCRWFKTRSCLLYLKIQICLTTAATMLLFLYGSCDPSADTYPFILSGLQMFLLASISSHISILIVMYIDIISLKKIPNVKVSTVSVMTASPMLLIVFAPLSRRVTNERLTCWWLCKGSLLFYIHFIVGLFFLLLFIFLYYSVMKKLFYLWNCTKVERRIILQRISFLHYTLLIFLSTAFMVISSTFYVNLRSSTSECVFGSSCALLGFVIVMYYIPKNEVSFCLKIIFPKIKGNGSKYSPELQVIPVQAGVLRNNVTFEAESSQSSSQSDSKSENICVQTYNEEENEETSPKPKRKKSVVFHRRLVTGCAGEEVQKTDDDLENAADNEENARTATLSDTGEENQPKDVKHKPDILWPVTQHNYISTSSCAENPLCYSPLHQNHPEILTTRVCVELGVMKNAADGSGAGGENSSTVVICSVDVEPCPGHVVELNEVKFTTNTIGNICVENTAQKFNEIRKCDTSIPADVIEKEKPDVLDRISQDLDYLLNRSPSPGKSRKHSFKNVNNSPKITQN